MLINYSKEVIRSNPDDIIGFSKKYFEALLKDQGYFEKQKQSLVKLDKVSGKADLQSDYKTMTLIGDESFSKVRNCIHKKSGVHKVVRLIRKADLHKVGLFEKEIETLKTLEHPNVNKIHESYEDNTFFYLTSDFL